MKIRLKKIPASVRHCQLHGEPYDVPAYMNVKWNTPSGKGKCVPVDENMTLLEIESMLRGHPWNMKNEIFEFVEQIHKQPI
jgi:hypothetical protein